MGVLLSGVRKLLKIFLSVIVVNHPDLSSELCSGVSI